MSELFATGDFPLPGYLDGSGPAADLVLGTRAVLVRNLAGVQFPGHAAAGELEAVRQEVEGAIQATDLCAGWSRHRLAELAQDQRHSLLEKLIISRQVANDPEKSVLLGSSDLSRSLTINDRDHLRLAGFASGFDPAAAGARVLELEGALETRLGFAYQEALGYLTSEPTRVGTGLVFTAFLHLPGLVMADEVDKIVNALHQLRFRVSGLRGAGTTVRGALFRVTSQVTLGRDESEIQEDFSFHVGKVLLHEKSARQQLFEQDPLAMEDAVHRSLATLQAARLITSQECFDRLSHLRLGVGLELLPHLTVPQLNRLLLWQQSAHLGLVHGNFPSPTQIQALRASFLRELLGSR